jgi:hypothetical protein
MSATNRSALAAQPLYYLIRGRDAADSLPLRLANRMAHLARIRVLNDTGCLLLAGPLPAVDAADPGSAGFVGSVIVARFESLAVARAWAESDPYIEAGAWVTVEVDPFVKVLP